ncbi:MAG: hypothetical protein RR719_04315 [Akkermansia sp.]
MKSVSISYKKESNPALAQVLFHHYSDLNEVRNKKYFFNFLTILADATGFVAHA